MKALILKDKNIPDANIEKLEAGLSSIVEEHTDIETEFFVEERDFSYYPTFEDSDGDMRPTDSWLSNLAKDVYSKYKEDIDHIFIEVHENNWRSGSIWGTNYSNRYSGYQVHYCRYDKDNQANTLGTAWHEYMHSPDALIKTYLNIYVETYLKEKGFEIEDWDKSITHGQHKDASYIRHKENTQWLELIKEPLKQSYEKRREIYFNTVKRPLMQQIINLSERVIVLLRQKIYQKNGVGR